MAKVGKRVRGRGQRGLSLVEVLVSMLVLSLGMVGLAALQARTVSYQLGAGQRAQLAGLLSDYAERVRSNLPQAPGQVANSPYLNAGKWADLSSKPVTAVSADCLSSDDGCSPAQVAAIDKSEWLSAVRQQLPLGTALVTNAGNGALNVTFMWVDKDRTQDNTDDGETTRDLVVSPQCDPTNMTGVALQSCCPEANLAGVRCANFSIQP